MGLREDCETDAAEPARELGDVFTWSGREWPGVIGDASDKAGLVSGGDFTEAKFVVVTPKAQFGATLPQQRDAVTIAGTDYLIGEINTSDSDPFLELTIINEP